MSNIQFSAPTPRFIAWYSLSKDEKKKVNAKMRQTLERELKKRNKIN